MKRFEAAYANWVLNNRFTVILVSLLIVVAGSYGMGRLTFDPSYRVYFSDDNPELLAFESMENTYTKDDNVMIVLAPRDGNVFTPQTLSAVEALTAAAWQVPYSNRVDSITNFQFTEGIDDDLVVRDMVSNAADIESDALAAARHNVMTEPQLAKQLIAADGRVTAILVSLQMPNAERATATPEIVGAVRTMLDDFRAQHPDIDIYLSGQTMMDNAFSESSLRDSQFLLPLSFLIMAVLLALLAGGFFGTLTTLVIIFASITTSFGISGYIGWPLNPTTTAAPVIILTVAVANCVHLLVTFAHEMHLGVEKREAMAESLRINLQPVFLASATTAIGFQTMNFSEVPPFNYLGNIVSFGVITSFIMTVGLLPAVMTLLPARTRKKTGDDYRIMGALAEFVIRRRSTLLWSTALVSIAIIANLPRNELNDVFVEYFDKSLEFRNHTDFMLDNLTGIYTVGYSLESGSSGGISDPDFLRDVEDFSLWLESQPEVVHVRRLTNIMKRLNKNMHGDDDTYYRLPSDRELAAQYLLLYEMSLPYGLDLNNQINVDKSSTKVLVTFGVVSSNTMIEFDQRARDWLAENARHVPEVQSAGTVLMFSKIGQRNIYAMIIGTSIALVLISGILIVALRSLKLGLVSLLPNLAPAAIGFGLWGVFVGEIGLSLSIVAGMTFGIVIDDSVHFLSKYLRARREKELSPQDAVRYAFRTVGRALVVTTIVLVAGFSVLATSPFEMNSGMGLMTAVIITIALIGVFLMLPPLLMKIEENDEHENKQPAHPVAGSSDRTADHPAAA